MIKKIFFDLDGTLINLNVEEFINLYLTSIANFFAKKGYNDYEVIAKAIFKSSMAMIDNDGSITNRELFWKNFTSLTNYKKDDIEPLTFEYYNTLYESVKPSILPINIMKEVVEIAYNKGYELHLTTNPLFPPIATKKRMEYGLINPLLFKDITTYETSHFCKPNPSYFKEVLVKHNINPDEVLLIGNDLKEDLCAHDAGILNTFIVTDNILNKDYEVKPKYMGTSKDLLDFINKLPSIK